MKGLPHYFLIGLISNYVYWLLLSKHDQQINEGFTEMTGAYLGWLTSENAQTKEMFFVISTLLISLFLIMIFNPVNLNNIISLLVFISVGWLGSLSSHKENY